ASSRHRSTCDVAHECSNTDKKSGIALKATSKFRPVCRHAVHKRSPVLLKIAPRPRCHSRESYHFSHFLDSPQIDSSWHTCCLVTYANRASLVSRRFATRFI